ncbi:Tetratricopeptide repeat-containing protein [Actinacidiphila alni]|uniref:Tetratricopeptide repeat-containing protein n=1 Tax=Actinacidiphila alni TaxID=380248 RepID=A0A1I2HYR9_9ACTN|nr:tetratricopeptide repeat protein [Actinacidiphila alni]SFF35305.1 Tetratricopeptide repeat-containing protein [Actinacidiphila alni]
MDPELVTLTASAASAVAGAMATDSWAAVKSRIVGLWRRYQPEQADEVATALDRDTARLTGPDGASHVPGPTDEVAEQWTRRLTALLAGHPEAAAALTELMGRPGGPPSAVIPHQLPGAMVTFVGRTGAIATLDTLLEDPDQDVVTPDGQHGHAVVVAVDGAPGIGKTTLAVHWAHMAADRFPDGQLYVNLHGYAPSTAPLEPRDAIRGFLDALGVSPQAVPVTEAAQAGLYRSLLAHRRLLIVLDNARDTDQVRPLLPGGSGCRVLVTSRSRLTGLAATDGARLVTLGLLSTDEARQILRQHLGTARVGAEPAAVAALLDRCACLPLSLSVVGARAATEEHLTLGDLAAELNDAEQLLDALHAGDSASDVRAVFSWSYRRLSSPSARLFRLLGLPAGPDIALPAVASLSGLPRRSARRVLGDLVDAHLVTRKGPGRYDFHDLLRAYAAERAELTDPEPDRQAALHRLVSHYLHTTSRAARLVNPHQEPADLTRPMPGVVPEDFSGYDAAVAWCEAERAVLIGTVAQAVRVGLFAEGWRLARCLTDVLDRQGHWHDQLRVQTLGLEAADRLGDPLGQAHGCRGLAHALTRLGRFEDAEPLYRRAIACFSSLGLLAREAGVELDLAWMWEENAGAYDLALRQARRALDLYTETGDEVGRARALNAVGWYQTLGGDHEAALRNCERALALLRTLDVPHDEAYTLESLGHAHQHLGHFASAAENYRASLSVFHRLGDSLYEATIHIRLGDLHIEGGDTASAAEEWHRALMLLEPLQHPQAAGVRERLARLSQGSSRRHRPRAGRTPLTT